MNKRRQERKQPAGSAVRQTAEFARRLLLPSAVALLIAPHLIPSEAVAAEGTHALPTMLWCVLLVAWGILTAFSARPSVVFAWSDVALLFLVGWHTLSGLIPREGVVTRGALNVVWLWISYGVAYFLLRQLLETSGQVRAVCAVMIGLAICLASHAYLQYFVTMPKLRQALAENPERMLRENNVPPDPSSQRHFEDRVRASDPLATFALTNSLAGFLAPWTIVTLGIALLVKRGGHPPAVWLTALAMGIFLLGCLLLTKSRTAVLAVVAGGVLIVLFGPLGRWRIGWRLPVAAGGILVLLGMVAVAVGGLDVQVLSEAPKSLLFRLEYWRSTAAMIGDFPLWGSGPGNFQDYYPRYKLPQASETIADPHNVFLELWATAGTPALLGLLAWIGLLAVDLSRTRGELPSEEMESAELPELRRSIHRIYLGAVAGIALGFALAFLAVYPLWTAASGGDIGILLIGLPLAGLTLWQLAPWIRGGDLDKSLLAIGLVTMLVNLCAAGAAAFPGVISSALVLASCALSLGKASRVWPVSRRNLPGLLLPPLALAAACLWTGYSPVLRQQALLHEADDRLAQIAADRGQLGPAIDRLYEAAAADPADSRPWGHLASIHFEQWLAGGDEEAWKSFSEAAEEWRRLRPAHFRQHAQRSAWYLQAWRKAGRKEWLSQAVEAGEEAADRYPASALAQAQLAWLYHLAGDANRARAHAERAATLDAIMPHEEFKLRANHVTDPLPDQERPEEWRTLRPENAEQTMQNLRKGEV